MTPGEILAFFKHREAAFARRDPLALATNLRERLRRRKSHGRHRARPRSSRGCISELVCCLSGRRALLEGQLHALIAASNRGRCLPGRRLDEIVKANTRRYRTLRNHHGSDMVPGAWTRGMDGGSSHRRTLPGRATAASCGSRRQRRPDHWSAAISEDPRADRSCFRTSR
jgi:hypothetical protein